MIRRLPFRKMTIKLRTGAAALEFAILTPVFLLLMLGLLDFGRAVMTTQIVTDAARVGARRAVIPGATSEEVTELVDDYLQGATLGAAGRSIQLLNSDGDEASVEDLESYDVVEVRVSVPYNQVGLGFFPNLANKVISARVQMRKEYKVSVDE